MLLDLGSPAAVLRETLYLIDLSLTHIMAWNVKTCGQSAIESERTGTNHESIDA
jgi:hypothetical protein